ncbi:hypothetical protein [Vandammella animalimorsus]|uniref:hypothetical protein n=1 Tax=Vandammella animalimorsus TaxID=2029117 RepID=UPI00117C342F|nr:hypothetical protein [Vandammella animalimorsus]
MSNETVRLLGSSLVQVLAVKTENKRTKDGRDYSVTEAECVLFNPDGSVFQAGSIRVPKSLVDAVRPGLLNFHFGFARSFNSAHFEVVPTHITLADSSVSPLAPIGSAPNPGRASAAATAKA